MANWCYNKVIITHDDDQKIQELYRICAGDFFNFILPPPIELCNEETLRHKQYNLEEFGADNLHDWRKKNWKNGYIPVDGCQIRTLSSCGSILTLGFDTKWVPAVGIYDELQRQGYHVKAYFCCEDSCFCGSYIYGIGEWINYLEDDQDIPLDIDLIFNGLAEAVKGMKKAFKQHVDAKRDDINVQEPEVSIQHDNDMAYFQGIVDEISC